MSVTLKISMKILLENKRSFVDLLLPYGDSPMRKILIMTLCSKVDKAVCWSHLIYTFAGSQKTCTGTFLSFLKDLRQLIYVQGA